MPRRTPQPRLPEQAQSGSAAAPPDLIDLGTVRGAYGVKGWARLALPGSDGAVLQQATTWWLRSRVGALRGAAPVEPQGFRRHGAAWLAKWAGCETPEQAESLKGATLAVPRSAFPPAKSDEWYWIDLLGSTVVDRQGEVLGVVAGLRENAGGQWLEVRAEGGEAKGEADPMLIPIVEQYVESVDVAGRRVQVDWARDW